MKACRKIGITNKSYFGQREDGEKEVDKKCFNLWEIVRH